MFAGSAQNTRSPARSMSPPPTASVVHPPKLCPAIPNRDVSASPPRTAPAGSTSDSGGTDSSATRSTADVMSPGRRSATVPSWSWSKSSSVLYGWSGATTTYPCWASASVKKIDW